MTEDRKIYTMFVCPDCNSRDARTERVEQTFPYGAGPDGPVDIVALVPIWHCNACGYEWTDFAGEEARAAAVLRHLAMKEWSPIPPTEADDFLFYGDPVLSPRHRDFRVRFEVAHVRMASNGVWVRSVGGLFFEEGRGFGFWMKYEGPFPKIEGFPPGVKKYL